MLKRRVFNQAASLAAILPAVLLWAQSPVTSSELPSGPMRSKAETACLECHEGRIIVQQRLSKAAWTREVDKMIKWGALVDAADHDPLVDYLSASFPPDKPPYEASRTARTQPKK